MLILIEDEFGVNEVFYIKFNNFIKLEGGLIWQCIIELCFLYFQDFDDLMIVIRKYGFSEEYERNKIVIVYYCRIGKSRIILALVVIGLVMCYLRVKYYLKYIYRCIIIWLNFDFYENEERIFEIIV